MRSRPALGGPFLIRMACHAIGTEPPSQRKGIVEMRIEPRGEIGLVSRDGAPMMLSSGWRPYDESNGITAGAINKAHGD
jgi:hypothetical protein